MPLTHRAAAYLSKMHRDPEYVVDAQELRSYLSASGIHRADAFLHYNEILSGYTLLTGDAAAPFHARLYTRAEVRDRPPIGLIEEEGLQYLCCGRWERAPFYFVLGEDGEIATFDGGGLVNPVFSSPEVFIENCALERHFAGSMNELRARFDLPDQAALLQLVADWGHYREASDTYNYWCYSDELVLHSGRWYDRLSHYVHLYGNTEAQAQDFAAQLQEKGLIV